MKELQICLVSAFQVIEKYPNIRFKIIQRRGYVSCQTNNAGNMAAEEYYGSDGATAFIGPGT